MESIRVLFSIIVPAYNSAAFIEKCIKSVLEQTYSEFELILVDDGSNDGTLSICKTYAESDLRVKVIHKKNGGHTSARNEGLKEATGEYVLFLDSDDWLGFDVLEICESKIIKNNYPDIFVYQIYNTMTKERFINNVPDGYYQCNEKNSKIIDACLMDKSGSSVIPKSLSGKVFKKSIIKENQLSIPKEVLIAEDAAAFVLSVLDSKSIYIDSKALYFCSVREESVSHSSDKDAFKRLPYLFACYKRKFNNCKYDMSMQFNRYIVSQLYTSLLLVIRSGENNDTISAGADIVLKDRDVLFALQKANFSLKGYKFLIKKFILRYRLWSVAKLLDRIKV